MDSNDTSVTSIAAQGFAVHDASGPFRPFKFKRRAPKPNDVLIRIHFCGICHTDIHQARNEWHSSTYPMVPGHEIVGIVEEIGSAVRRFQMGDSAGVGCIIASCRTCKPCKYFAFALLVLLLLFISRQKRSRTTLYCWHV